MGVAASEVSVNVEIGGDCRVLAVFLGLRGIVCRQSVR